MTWRILLEPKSPFCLLTPRTSAIKQLVRSIGTSKKWDVTDIKHRQPSPCSNKPPDKKPCLDEKMLVMVRGTPAHAKLIRAFLYNYFWPLEPSVVGLWMDRSSPYLSTLTDSYAYSGDRFIVFEYIQRTKERRMVGFAVAKKKYRWMIDELEEWAHCTQSVPEKIRMYFYAHCLKSPNFFDKYDVDYVYDIECLATAYDVVNHGIDDLLLSTIIQNANELRYSLVQYMSASHYTSAVCKRCGMKRAWTMDYKEFVDNRGKSLFFPRRPHHSVGIYVKYFDPTKPMEEPCLPQW